MKKIKIILSALLIFGAYSCDTVDFGDTDENVNGPSEYNSGALLAAAQRRLATTGGRQYKSVPTLYVQYQSQPAYQDESRYGETPYTWTSFYVQTLSNLEEIVNQANDPEVNTSVSFLSNGSVNNQIGIAKIMKAIIFRRITDSYGDIPYSEALNPEIQSPKYDTQEFIYKDLINELKEARDLLDATEAAPTGDLIYDGDVSKWKKFANSSILSLSIQLSNKYPGVSDFAATEFNSALTNTAGVIESIEDEAWFTHLNTATFENPYSGFRAADYALSEYFVNALQGDGNDFSSTTSDSRLQIFADDASLEGYPYGLESNPSGLITAKMSSNIASPDAPAAWLTAAYTYLNRADAANLGWTSEDPANMLEMGIQKSYETLSAHYGVDITADAATFAAARVSDASSTSMAQVIGEEKWVALYPEGFEAWSEWRRTDYPILTPSPDPLNSSGEIATRYMYPTSEISLNGANYSSGVSNLSPATDNNDSKVWWDQ